MMQVFDNVYPMQRLEQVECKEMLFFQDLPPIGLGLAYFNINTKGSLGLCIVVASI